MDAVVSASAGLVVRVVMDNASNLGHADPGVLLQALPLSHYWKISLVFGVDYADLDDSSFMLLYGVWSMDHPTSYIKPSIFFPGSSNSPESESIA